MRKRERKRERERERESWIQSVVAVDDRVEYGE